MKNSKLFTAVLTALIMTIKPTAATEYICHFSFDQEELFKKSVSTLKKATPKLEEFVYSITDKSLHDGETIDNFISNPKNFTEISEVTYLRGASDLLEFRLETHRHFPQIGITVLYYLQENSSSYPHEPILRIYRDEAVFDPTELSQLQNGLSIRCE